MLRHKLICGLAAVLLSLAACTPEPELSVTVSLRRSVAGPLLRTFAAKTGANLDVRYVKRSDPVGEDFDVLWTGDPAVTFGLADAGVLAPLPRAALAGRPSALADQEGLWAAASVDVRVFVYDPARIDEDSVPTRFEELLEPRWAKKLILARPDRSPSALWHAAALFAAKGAQPTAAFYRDLHDAGALFVESERDVLKAVAGKGRPLGVVDGEIAFSGRELGRGIGILIPDQDGMGAVLRATTVALHRTAADSPRALALVEYLLSVPVARRLALMSAHVAPLRDGAPSAGALALRDLKATQATQEEIAAHVEAAQERLSTVLQSAS